MKKIGRLAVKTSPVRLAVQAARRGSQEKDQLAAEKDIDEVTSEDSQSLKHSENLDSEAAEESSENSGDAEMPGALQSYKVNYRGGHPDYPKAKVGGIILGLFPDRFKIEPTTGSKKWFSGISIPYSNVRDVQIVARTVSTAEGILGGVRSRQLNQDNNIHIEYLSGDSPILLRLEMLTGVSVMGQAKKCREFEDRLRNLGIRNRFLGTTRSEDTKAGDDIPDQIAKLAALHEQGILSVEEFQAKKAELLFRM